ncbi:MAG: sigma-54-dependent Fis family transcriptional regulator [Nitrospinae bacterium]|nr:sigma-54-dependent Fis family transcriptional regulator [Nitrospinota bacterium]
MLQILAMNMETWGFGCFTAMAAKDALAILENNDIDLIMSDYQMQEMNGLDLLREARARYGQIPFIMLTGYGTVDSAVSSMKEGADDYIQKPCEPQRMRTTIVRALQRHKLTEENRKLKSQLLSRYSFQNIITKSKAMVEALKLAERVSRIPNTTVAIYGESGVGKEVLARAIHVAGERMENNFVAVNCAAIPSSLLESELFGHVKGAFTGADRNRPGKFDAAQKGTILLDEIGDMPYDLQAKILRVLEERVFEMVGSNVPVKADFRLIVATNKNLVEMVKTGAFREDLYHRISAFPITIPPLRERKEDIPLLCHFYLDQFRSEFGKQLPGISENALEMLVNYSWPGNVRELRNCMERAAILTDDELIQPDHLIIKNAMEAAPATGEGDGGPMAKFEISMPYEALSLDGITNEILRITLERCGNNKSRAADLLKVDRSMFYRRK